MALFEGKDSDPHTLSEVIGQAVGAGSSCWDNMGGAGKFQSERAAEIVVEVVDWVNEHFELKDEFK